MTTEVKTSKDSVLIPYVDLEDGSEEVRVLLHHVLVDGFCGDSSTH